MPNLQPRPAHPGQPSPARAAHHPVRRASADFRVNYTVNGMRAAWTIGAFSEGHARNSFKELVPGATINLISREGQW